MKEKMIQLLEQIKRDLIFLANEVEHNIRSSVKALIKKDKVLADQIIAGDKEIDRMEVEIENKFLELLALQQPVAIDLRFIVGGLKMNNDLERIGDHAVNIARTVKKISSSPYIEPIEDIPEMSETACKMLHDAVNAFVHKDSELARDVCQRDSVVDEFYDKIIQRTVEVLKKKPNLAEQGFAAARIARSLERVADLATNIGEDVVFMKEAKIIRHRFEE
ncbi:MAG: phosphate signaling complex protein PhoU [Calditrichia bacterium]